MASTGKKMEYLIIIPDKPGTQQKRLAIRPTHLANLKPLIESGNWKMGGALLTETPVDSDPTKFSFHGSTLVAIAESHDEIMDILRKDVYAAEVWDLENVQIWPFICGFRFP